jgi:hypothetical protein
MQKPSVPEEYAVSLKEHENRLRSIKMSVSPNYQTRGNLYDMVLQRSEQLRLRNIQNSDPRFTHMLNEFQNAVISKQS